MAFERCKRLHGPHCPHWSTDCEHSDEECVHVVNHTRLRTIQRHMGILMQNVEAIMVALKLPPRHLEDKYHY
jgi:hypothetical protein